MMIDYTFFQDGLLRVDGALSLGTPSPTNQAIQGLLESFIDRYEAEYLCKLLGEELYEDFLLSLSEEKSAANDWEGLKRLLVVEKPFKRSPIANYVYFHLLRSCDSDATLNGVKIDTDNGKPVSPERKMRFAWNDMVLHNRKLYGWLRKANYKGWKMDEELLEFINTFNI